MFLVLLSYACKEVLKTDWKLADEVDGPMGEGGGGRDEVVERHTNWIDPDTIKSRFPEVVIVSPCQPRREAYDVRFDDVRRFQSSMKYLST